MPSVIGWQTIGGPFGIAGDRHEPIIKIMRNAAGPSPDALHLLCLDELRLQTVPLGELGRQGLFPLSQPGGALAPPLLQLIARPAQSSLDAFALGDLMLQRADRSLELLGLLTRL